jgi:glycosyltransferase involved in cell wall biosynthesis
MSRKPNLVFCGPVATRSGYGEHARDLVTSLLRMDKFNIKVISINWGGTPMNALNASNPEHKQILDSIIPGLTEQPDIWIQCTIPNEFQPVGKYNIGVTAGIETDLCAPEWIEGCNRMNLVIVPSKHSKDVLINTKYEKRDKSSGNNVGNLEVSVPIEVLHEGVRLDIFNKDLPIVDSIKETLDNIKEDFAFLFVGHWLRGDFTHDRKDVSGLIYTFLETFGDTENPPALLLKASSGAFSITDRSKTIEKIELIKKMVKKKTLPNIYLLHGDLTDEEMNSLYNHEKVKSFVSFTKGEGYGRPIAEFITTGKPVLVSGWSGHVDFVNPAFHTYLTGDVKPIHKTAVWEGVLNEGASWFNVNYQNAAEVLRKVYSKYSTYLSNSKKSVKEIETKWSFDAMTKNFDEYLTQYLPKFAEKISLNLPQLKKLPTLKKVETP